MSGQTDLQESALHTPADVAKILQVSLKSVRRWISRGELKHYRIGRQIRISPADLDAFVAARRAQ